MNHSSSLSDAKHQLLEILNIAPEIREIMVSVKPLEEKRESLRHFLSSMLYATFNDAQVIAPLEWVLARDAINALKHILSPRSEHLADFGLLKYFNDIIHDQLPDDQPAPSPGFLAELRYLLRGVMGKSGIYTDDPPAFLQHHGREAAEMRSAELSRMARTALQVMDRYRNGLEPRALRRRSQNKARILKYFGATEVEWDQWPWQIRHIISDADTLKALIRLTRDEYQAVLAARRHKIPFGITPYYLSLLDYHSHRQHDAALRAQVIPSRYYVEQLIAAKTAQECSMDFMLENDTSPLDGITRRYPMIAILKPVTTCPQICVYCQRNWEIEDVYSRQAFLGPERLDQALRWIANTPEIREVLITGGDPLLLADHKIESILMRLARLRQVERIRIGTRTPVTLPQRITEALVKTIGRFHLPGRREVMIVTHFEHAYEVTPQAMEAVQKFRRSGMDVYNQLVYTFYNSRRFEAVALRNLLRLIGVTPYYTFNTKGKAETDDYRVPIPRLLQEQKEEARLMPGTVRTDEIVFNVPRLGKNYLRAAQHHDVISILPDGCRVYEFHPWEKKLSLVDTYIYKDVPVYDYLQRLAEAGENPDDYHTIWYYY